MGVSWKQRQGNNGKVRDSKTESKSGMESPCTLEAHDVCLFLPQTRSMFPFEMVESTAVLKSLGTSETNDPSQTVLTGSAGEPKESCDWCRITAIPPLFTSITAQWNSWGTVWLSYDAVYIRRRCKVPPEVLQGCFWIIILANRTGTGDSAGRHHKTIRKKTTADILRKRLIVSSFLLGKRYYFFQLL